MNLVNEIKTEMERQGLTQRALANVLGLSRQGLSNKMNGHTDFTYTEVSVIAQTLGMAHADLVARAEAAAASPTSPTPPAAHSATALAGALEHARQAAEEVA